MSSIRPESSRSAVAQSLRRCRLFAGVDPADRGRIAAITVQRPVPKGDYLFHEGSPVHGFYLVQRGAIKLHRVNPLGREQVIHIFRPVESFGEESLMADAGYPAAASATEDSLVLLVQKAEFLAMVLHRPELALCLLRGMDRHVHMLIGLLDDLTLKDVKTRVAEWLLQQCPDPASHQPVSIQLPTTKRVLAAELGTVSETFSRTVAKLRELDLLTVAGGTVTLPCPARLAAWLGHPAPEPPVPGRGEAVGCAVLRAVNAAAQPRAAPTPMPCFR
jgi:CRP/FNR family transcriptional regulator